MQYRATSLTFFYYDKKLVNAYDVKWFGTDKLSRRDLKQIGKPKKLRLPNYKKSCKKPSKKNTSMNS